MKTLEELARNFQLADGIMRHLLLLGQNGKIARNMLRKRRDKGEQKFCIGKWWVADATREMKTQ